MQVYVHDVEAHVAGTHLAQEGIEVRSVVIEQTSGLMHELGDFHYLRLEHAESVGVGHHDAGYLVVEKGFQILHVNRAVGL